MRALVLLALSNTFLITSGTTLPQFNPLQPTYNREYIFPTPDGLDHSKYMFQIVPRVPIGYESPYSLYRNPYTNVNYANVHDNYAKILYDEYERRMRMKLLYDSMAEKLSDSSLTSKFANPQNNYNLRIQSANIIPPFNSPLNNQKDVNNLNFATGKRRFNEEKELDEVATVEQSKESIINFDKNDSKLVKKVTDEKPDLNDTRTGTLLNINNVTKDGHNVLALPIQEVPLMRNGVPYSFINQNTVNEVPNMLPYETYVTLNNIDNRFLKHFSLPTSSSGLSFNSYRRPFYKIWNPIEGLLNTIKFPNNRVITFNKKILNYDLNNLLVPQYYLNELEQIKSYIINIMQVKNNANPLIIQFLNDANNLDLSKIHLIDQSKLIKINKSDLDSLKKYLVLILNKYGITPYTFKLLEFINLAEGKPKNESYLLHKVLMDRQAVNYLNTLEMNQLKGHLQQILSEYGESPYILPFVQSIGGIQMEQIKNDNFDSSDYVNDHYMETVYLYLLQNYNSNPYVLKILQNVNEIYENFNSGTQLPILKLNDYKGLSYLNQNDLNLMFKYISQIVKKRGENNYLNQLLVYIMNLQEKLNKGVNATIIKDNQKIDNGLDITELYNYLLHLNERDTSNPEVLNILHQLFNKIPNDDYELSVIAINNTKQTLNMAELEKIKQILLKNETSEIRPLVLKILEQLYQVTKEPEEKLVLPPAILDGSQKLVDINLYDLEQMYQYLQNKHNGVSDPYLDKILHILQTAKTYPHNNEFVKLKYNDLEQIYNYLIQSPGEDVGSSVIIKILQYLNGFKNNKNPLDQFDVISIKDSIDISKIIDDNKVDLHEIYKFLINMNNKEKANPLLMDMLQHINKTLILPNGQLKIKVITLNNTEPIKQINPLDLERFYLYLQKFKEQIDLKNELREYIIKNKFIQTDINNQNAFTAVNTDALDRIKNFLLALIKEHGRIPYVFQILLDIHQMQGIPGSNNKHIFVLNDTNSKANEDDLKILTKYLTSTNMSDGNSDIYKILEYIREYQERIKKEKKKTNETKPLKQFVLQIINNEELNPAIKDILKYISIDNLDDNSDLSVLDLDGSKTLMGLNQNDLNVLTKYLLQITNRFGPNPRANQMLYYIDKIRDKVKKEKDNFIIFYNHTYWNENEKQDTEHVKVSGDDFNLINKYLLDLLKKYGKNNNILHILHGINHIREVSGNDIDMTNLITIPKDNVAFMKISDLNVLYKYLLLLIQKHGPNSNLLKILQDVNKLYSEPIKDTKAPVVQINNTHSMAVLEPHGLNRVKSYLIRLINNYGPNPYLVNIMDVINSTANSPNGEYNSLNENPNVFIFNRLNPNDLSQLKQYILQLITKHGARPEFVQILQFINIIYGDIEQKTNTNQKEQYILDITKEIKNLREHGVIEIIKNIDRDQLNYLYTQLLHKIIIAPNTLINNELSTIMERLINIYKNEVDPVKRYILLKFHEYILISNGAYETFWKPGFVNILLDLKDNEQNDDINNKIIIQPPDEKHFVMEPYDYTKDIELTLTKLINKMLRNQTNDNDFMENNKKVLANYTNQEVDNNGGISINKNLKSIKDISCVAANKKFTVILKVMNNIFNLNQHEIDLSMRDLEKIFDMFVIFKKKLNLEKQTNIPMSVLIDELENRIQQSAARCRQESNSNVRSLVTKLIGNLRGIIAHLKSNNVDKDKIKGTVLSLVEKILPDLSAIAVKVCEAKTTKQIMHSLYSNIYTHTLDGVHEKQIVLDSTVQGNDAEDFIQTQPMLELLEEISKLKNVNQ